MDKRKRDPNNGVPVTARRAQSTEAEGNEPAEIIGAREVAGIIGVHEKTVRKWTKAKQIPFRKVGGLYLYSCTGILRWLKCHRQMRIRPKPHGAMSSGANQI